MDVAGECGLGDVMSALGQQVAQFVLTGNGGAVEQFTDCGVTLVLHAMPDFFPTSAARSA